jgi:hypothetical protein
MAGGGAAARAHAGHGGRDDCLLGCPAAPARGGKLLTLGALALALQTSASRLMAPAGTHRSALPPRLGAGVGRAEWGRMHANAIHGTGLDAQRAAGALRLDDGVHLSRGTDDGVHGASLQTQGASDACVLLDGGDRWWPRFTAARVEGFRFHTQRPSQRQQRCGPTGRTSIDIGLARGEGFRVGTTGRVAAPAALGLGQQPVNLID